MSWTIQKVKEDVRVVVFEGEMYGGDMFGGGYVRLPAR